MPLVVRAANGSYKTYALLDDGSTKTVISEALATKLALKRTTKSTTLHTVEGVTQRQRQMVDFEIQNLKGDISLTITQALVNDFLTMAEDHPPKNEEISHLDYMQGVEFEELDHSDVDIILSVDHSWTWLGGEVRRSACGKMIGLKTSFGWTLAGGKGGTGTDSCLKTALEVDNQEIQELLKQIYRRDFPDIPKSQKHLSLDDKYAINQMEQTIRFDESIKHYRVGIPWRKSREAVAERLNKIDSSGHALQRLKKSMARIKSNPPHDPPIAVELKYVQNQMKGIFEDKHAEFIEPSEVPEGVPSWVLPLHIVYRIE